MSTRRSILTLVFYLIALAGGFLLGRGDYALVMLVIGVVGATIAGMPVWTWMLAGKPKRD